MATIHFQKIISVASVAPGATYKCVWNNPPLGTVLGFFANPIIITNPIVPPDNSSGQGEVSIGRVSCHASKSGPTHHHEVIVEVVNTGTQAAGFDLYMSWAS